MTLAELVTNEAAAGIHELFAEVRERKERAEHSVQAGREFVAAYVQYVHYVQGLHLAAQAVDAHHAGRATTSLQAKTRISKERLAESTP